MRYAKSPSTRRIRVIAGADGSPLGDIATDSDSVAVANVITEQVRAIAAGPGASLHVLIAGRRKGFYLGDALSLFGRAGPPLACARLASVRVAARLLLSRPA